MTMCGLEGIATQMIDNPTHLKGVKHISSADIPFNADINVLTRFPGSFEGGYNPVSTLHSGREMSRVISTLREISSIHDLNLHGLILSITTDGILGNTTLDPENGTGRTGNWMLDAKRKISCAVVRVEQKDGSYLVYQGSIASYQPVKGSPRKVVLLENVFLAGVSWGISKQFNGNTGRGGVTYVELPELPFQPRGYREGTSTTVMTRPDQSPFANEVRENCHHRCVVTGASLRCITEAAHLTPHCDRGIPDKTNGLLLRRDIHALFDNHEFAIDPDTLKLYVTKAAKDCLSPADYSVSELKPGALKTFINPENLRSRWEEFRRRHHNEFASVLRE